MRLSLDLGLGSVATLAAGGADPRKAVWKASRQRVQANGGHSRSLFIGSSLVRGVDGVTRPGVSFDASYAGISVPNRFAQLLNARYAKPVSAQGWIGDGGFGITMPETNPTVVRGSGWASAAIGVVGGLVFSKSSGAELLTVTPSIPVSAFEVYAMRRSDQGHMGCQIGSDTLVDINLAGSDAVFTQKFTAAGGLGTHTFKQSWISGTVHAFGVIAYDDTTSGFIVINGGRSGATTANFTTNTSPWSPLNAYDNYGTLDLLVFQPSPNDYFTTAAVSVATYKGANRTALQAMIATGATIILETPTPIDPAGANNSALQADYVQAIRELAAEFPDTVILYDSYAQFGSWAQALADGYATSGQNPHFNATGYQARAAAIDAILAAA